MPDHPTVVDLFAGAGGLSIGLRSAGLEPVAAVEFDVDACKTYLSHEPDADLYDCDVAEVPFGQFRGVDVVAGGPPCQPFSIGGKRLSHADERDGIPQFIRAVREIGPAAFLMENVPGLAAASKREYFGGVLSELADLGYDVAWRVINTADYGVPQKRQRLVVVGLRGSEFVFPRSRARRRVSGDVLDPTVILGEPNEAIITYAKRPDLRPNPYDGHLYNGGGRPIDLDAPAPTMVASMGGNKTPWLDTLGVVPEYHRHLAAGGTPRSGVVPGARRITVEEAAILQTFPRSITFAGRRSSQYRQVGNAVPPRAAAAIGRALASQL